jgi:hypothetical protein
LNNIFYLSYKSVSNNNTRTFFIKQLLKGKINLYERGEIPYDNQFLYLFTYGTVGSYYILKPFENDFQMSENSYYHQDNNYNNNNNQRIFFKSNNTDERFKLIMTELLSDCATVTVKLRTGMYTTNDITSIIREYNNCTGNK